LEALLLALEDHHRPLAASVVSHPVDSLEHLLRDLLAVEDPLEDLLASVPHLDLRLKVVLLALSSLHQAPNLPVRAGVSLLQALVVDD
jgi:hypothetical protein